MRPRVTVLTTGDELQEPGEPLRPGAIRNSNAHSVAALVERAGAELLGAEIVADDPEATERGVEGALDGDVVVICGGVSVGEHDHVRPARDAARASSRSSGASPCGPARRRTSASAAGRAKRSAASFGLPGNPVSAMVTFLLFARPAIRAMMGAADARRRATATLAAEHPALREAHPARPLPARAGR